MAQPSPSDATTAARRRSVDARVGIVAATMAAMLVSFTALLETPPTVPAAAAISYPTSGPSDSINSPSDLTVPTVGTSVPTTAGTGGVPVAVYRDPIPKPNPAPRCPSPPSDATLASVVRHGARAAKVVALTFDDGWNPADVLKIVAILEREKVNATFFPVGAAIQESPATWQAVAGAGFPIGNHTFDHKKLTRLCYADQLAELDRQEAVVASRLGLAPLPMVRPPYGSYDDATRLAATGAGARTLVLWDVDSRDWSGLSVRAITGRALAGTNGSIVLLHTFVDNTVIALPTIIARYRARGFTFVTVGQLLGIDGPVPFP